MCFKILFTPTFLALLFGTFQILSAQPNAFPDVIQSRFDSGEYVLTDSGHLGLAIPGISPYVGTYYYYLTSELDERVLIRYSIGLDSVSSIGDETTPLTGIAYLDGARKYNLSESFFGGFTLYLEDIEQNLIVGNFMHETIGLTYLTSDALIDGTGTYQIILDDCKYECKNGNDLVSGEQPWICLSLFCEVGATLNLTRVEYVDIGNGEAEIQIDEFAFGETEFPPLYEHHSAWPGEDGIYNGDKEEMWDFQRFELEPILLGDANRDGVVNLLDVNDFVEVLSSGQYQFESDITMDQTVDLFDVSFFVTLLSS